MEMGVKLKKNVNALVKEEISKKKKEFLRKK